MIAANSRTVRHICKVLLWVPCVMLAGCQANSYQLEPQIVYEAPKRLIEARPSAFPPLTQKEARQEWAKELYIAQSFANELDLYRAITNYKRALFLLPENAKKRRGEIEYGILLSYYLGKKYQDVIDTFECGSICNAGPQFPAYKDLLIILHDSYHQIGKEERACQMLQCIEALDPQIAAQLELSQAVQEADLSRLSDGVLRGGIASDCLLDSYHSQAKSVNKARTLNALLPGAGYLYVGQKQTALTSFLINALFIAAAYHFFDHGNIAAGLIVSSLEFGWYYGGINGAGIAAREYNERIYDCHAKEFMLQQRLFPVLMLQYSF